MNHVKTILNRLKESLELTTDQQLADWLGCKLNTLRTWYQRDTVDWPLLIDRAQELDLNYLLRGSAPIDGWQQAVVSVPRQKQDCSECEKKVAELQIKLDAYREIIHDLGAGKKPTSGFRRLVKKHPQTDL